MIQRRSWLAVLILNSLRLNVLGFLNRIAGDLRDPFSSCQPDIDRLEARGLEEREHDSDEQCDLGGLNQSSGHGYVLGGQP